MSEYMVRALGPDTSDAFAGLAQPHNGVFGGCWCTFFHTMHSEKTFGADDNRSLKRRPELRELDARRRGGRRADRLENLVARAGRGPNAARGRRDRARGVGTGRADCRSLEALAAAR